MLTGNPTYPYNAGNMTAHSLQGEPKQPGRPPLDPVAVLTSIPRTFIELHRQGSLVYESILPAPVGIFLVLFLPAPLLLRRRLRHGGPALLFVYGTLAVWAPAMAILRNSVHADMTLRYALPAFLLWPMLLTGPALDLFERFARPAKGAFLAVIAFAFLVPWTGLLIIENSGNQLRFLAGRMSEPDYLAGALLPYPAIQAVGKASQAGDATLSFDACASLYYPEPRQFRCRRVTEWSDPAGRISPALRDGDYRFLILRAFLAPHAGRAPGPAGTALQRPGLRRLSDPWTKTLARISHHVASGSA